MRALILAAGRGTRMGAAAGGLPKCLLPIGGRPLILHQLDALAEAGVGSPLIVVGYRADAVERTVGGRAETLLNPRFATTNSLYSFLLAGGRLDGPFLLLHGDMLFGPELVRALLRAGEDALAYDSSSGRDPEDMKVSVADGRLADISKEIPRGRISGQSVGMLHLGWRSAEAVLREAGRIAAAGGEGSYWAAALRAVVPRVPLKAVDVAGTPWIEIDTPDDLERARDVIWPRIASGARSAGARKRILFAGTAHVHFVCCLPIYRRLAGDPRLEFWLSGGFRRGSADEERASYDLEGFYDPFPVDRARVIPMERAREEDFDVFSSASAAGSIFPRSAGRKIQIFHGMSFRNFSAREKYMKFDIICLAGSYLAGIYRRRRLVRPDGPMCVVTGFAKDDALVDGSLDREATLRRVGVDPRRPTILFAPVGARHNAMETMGLDVVRAIGADGRWNLLVKLHDHEKDAGRDWGRELRALESDRVRHVKEPDIVPFIHAADLVLTDASSVATEFTLLDRPIVFLDVPELLEEVDRRGGLLDLETYGRRIGVVVERAEDVVGAIADSLAHPGREGALRREVARLVFHDPGRATGRVAGVVLYAAGLSPGLPEGVEVLKPDALPAGVPAALP